MGRGPRSLCPGVRARVRACAGALALASLATSARADPGASGDAPPAPYRRLIVSAELLGLIVHRYGLQVEVVLSPHDSVAVYSWVHASDDLGETRSPFDFHPRHLGWTARELRGEHPRRGARLRVPALSFQVATRCPGLLRRPRLRGSGISRRHVAVRAWRRCRMRPARSPGVGLPRPLVRYRRPGDSTLGNGSDIDGRAARARSDDCSGRERAPGDMAYARRAGRPVAVAAVDWLGRSLSDAPAETSPPRSGPRLRRYGPRLRTKSRRAERGRRHSARPAVRAPRRGCRKRGGSARRVASLRRCAWPA